MAARCYDIKWFVQPILISKNIIKIIEVGSQYIVFSYFPMYNYTAITIFVSTYAALRDLEREAKMDLGEKPMKEVVCTLSEQSDDYYYPCFSTIILVTPVHKDLHEAAKNSEEHDVFLALCMSTPQTPSDVSSVRDWFKSVKVRCSKILKDSRDLTLSVDESRELFTGSGFSERKIAGELKTLSELVDNKSGSEQSTAKAIFESIEYYEILHTSAEAATLLSDVAAYFHCDCISKLIQDSKQVSSIG